MRHRATLLDESSRMVAAFPRIPAFRRRKSPQMGPGVEILDMEGAPDAPRVQDFKLQSGLVGLFPASHTPLELRTFGIAHPAGNPAFTQIAHDVDPSHRDYCGFAPTGINA